MTIAWRAASGTFIETLYKTIGVLETPVESE